ncbi:MAG TPA: hypothetical protein PL124_05460 [Candidatus Cloacimonadota bacterium]|nr:hypothetical protein [Candidatus Cloacimonadota bacterium]HPS38844.1 hypothetical protein [Candidatus Cloacimonadota bacterium]
MPYIDQQEILNASHGGLDIILSYYPQANDSLKTNRKEFKIRDERTPSARLKQLADGNWVVTDFGDDGTPRNAIQVCMKEDEITYREAIVKLAARYNLGGINPEINKPGFEKRPAAADEKEGEMYFDIKEEMTDAEVAELGPLVNRDVCKKYNVYALNSFTYIKNREAQITTSNDNYPIYMVDHGEFKKIYQPKNPDKAYRFRYSGTRTKDYVNGLAQVKKAFDELNIEYDPESNDPDKKKMQKLTEIIIASGERDALNIAGHGYQVIWMNSESQIMDAKLYSELTKMTEHIYNLPDIDATGRKQAFKLGLQYLDIRTVWLPQRLREYHDNRGKPRKDFRDYVELWPRIEDFKKLMRVAMPMRFWDEQYGDGGIKYFFNNEQAYHFLMANGFYQLENKNLREGMMFIHMNGNIIREVDAEDCRKFIQNFMADRYLPIPLRNTVHRSNQLGDSSLRGLDEIKLDFTDYDKTTQYLFFVNRTWKVTPRGILELKPGEVDRYVWEEEVIQHKVSKKDPPFTIKFNGEDSEYEIDINNTDSIFFRFLINASRIHWKTEFFTRATGSQDENKAYIKENRYNISGKRLDPDESWEQRQHLINKIFSIGYLLHRYKDPARPWCVFAMDNKITETGESHGRSGKSLCYRTIRYFMKSVTLNGRNPKLTENPHVFDRITEHTDYVLVDDADQYLNFGFFFNALQGDMEVNPKNNQSYEIPFEHVPKFCITSNFTLRNIDPSTEGRILYTVFSDYYHVRTEGEDYTEDFTIRDDFGKVLFNDYNEEEWNDDFNFFAACLQFYLSVPREIKLNPPMDNVTKRNLRTEMGEAFKNWADVYFDMKEGNCDRLIERDKAFKDFEEKSGQHKWTTNKFTKALKAWCRYTEYVEKFNPDQFRNSSGRIIRKVNNEAAEMIFVQTRAISAELLIEASSQEAEVDEETKPF